jgi:hypothetical protein
MTRALLASLAIVTTLTTSGCTLLDPAQARFEEAKALADGGRYDEAVVAYDDVAAKWPESAEAKQVPEAVKAAIRAKTEAQLAAGDWEGAYASAGTFKWRFFNAPDEQSPAALAVLEWKGTMKAGLTDLTLAYLAAKSGGDAPYNVAMREDLCVHLTEFPAWRTCASLPSDPSTVASLTVLAEASEACHRVADARALCPGAAADFAKLVEVPALDAHIADIKLHPKVWAIVSMRSGQDRAGELMAKALNPPGDMPYGPEYVAMGDEKRAAADEFAQREIGAKYLTLYQERAAAEKAALVGRTVLLQFDAKPHEYNFATHQYSIAAHSLSWARRDTGNHYLLDAFAAKGPVTGWAKVKADIQKPDELFVEYPGQGAYLAHVWVNLDLAEDAARALAASVKAIDHLDVLATLTGGRTDPIDRGIYSSTEAYPLIDVVAWRLCPPSSADAPAAEARNIRLESGGCTSWVGQGYDSTPAFPPGLTASPAAP